jgi:fatty-acyl-CoA synthase
VSIYVNQVLRREAKVTLDELIELSNTTIGQVFDETVAKYPKNEAYVFQDDRITWKHCQAEVNKLARGLLKLGVKKGDVVAVWMTNSPEWVYSFLAIAKIGAVIGCVNTRFKHDELSYCLRQSDVTTLIMKDSFLGGKINILGVVQELVPELITYEPGELKCEKFPTLKRVICVGKNLTKGMYSFDELMELGGDRALDEQLAKVQASVNPDDISNHVYTSGTTGLPKAVLNTHRGWIRLNFMHGSEECMGVRESDRILGALPFAGGMGLSSIIFSIVNGVSLFTTEVFDPEETCRLIERERLTGAYIMVPTQIRMMLDHPNIKKYNLSSFKRTLLSGEPVPPDLVEALYKMGMDRVLIIYGLTECHGDFTSARPSDSLEQLTATVGYPQPWVSIKIIDPKTGKELPPGEDGEICVKGICPDIEISKGYYKMPKETAKFIDKDGWAHTGDLGHIRRKDGYLKLSGRIKDMIIVGGYNVYPAEVESLIIRYPKVKHVSVVGVPDRRLGEVPMAFVQLREGEGATETEIIDFCKEKLANTKVPKYIKFVKEFPTTLQGKVKKSELREQAIRELGL